MRILNTNQENMLNRERKLLSDLRVALVNFGASQEDQITLANSIHQLDELFLLVVVGEFNAGKSAFINALLGEDVLKEGVTPTTTQINILRYGSEYERNVEHENMHVLTAPVEILTDISIVDTPGTNAIIRQHEEITSQFVPRSDLVLFITSADRPFTESERTFMQQIRDWGKKVVVVLNKIDLFEDTADIERVTTYIKDNTRILLDITPEIFPVSSRYAQRAKKGEPTFWEISHFEPLEMYIHETLDESGRLQLKFQNPLGVGMHLVDKYSVEIKSRLDLLQDDFTTLEDVDKQLTVYKEDMYRDFEFRMSDIENELFDMERRGTEYFDDTLRLAKVFDLLNKSRIEKEFEQRVVADSPQEIERKVGELIDWLVDSDLRQWQAVMEHLADRRQQHKERIVGSVVGTSFHHDRQHLIEAVGRETSRVVDSYNKTAEAEKIASDAQASVAALAAVEVGAVGLGTLVAILATTAAVDVTGVLLAGVIAALGLFVIPARRRQAKAEMREKISGMRLQLMQSLRKQFSSEIERSLQQINDAISPYTRFVRAERNKLQEVQAEMDEIRIGLNRLQVEVEDF
jgi:small GTP-binding protein